MNKRLFLFTENFAESGVACLLTMVQGNILVLGLGHWIVASQTGVPAGTAAATAYTLLRNESRLLLAGVLGLSTALIDHLVHSGRDGERGMTEAVVTGLGAATLSYLAGIIFGNIRQRRLQRQSGR